MWYLLSGIYLGWALGTNDSAKIFGPAIAANTVRYKTGVILFSIFILVGALLEGSKVMETIGGISELSRSTAFISTLAAGLTVTAMSFLAMPVSTSQAIIGALVGIGLVSGTPDFGRLLKIVICWILTPFVAIVFSYILYRVFAVIFQHILADIQARTVFLRLGLLLVGSYSAYSLGANNVANVAGVYVGSGVLSAKTAALIGGLSIAFGALTYSKNVMRTIGKKIVPLDDYSAFISTLSGGLTLHMFTQFHVPVSSSQAIVGALVGVGLVREVRVVGRTTLFNILFAWVFTPVIPGLLSYGLTLLFL